MTDAIVKQFSVSTVFGCCAGVATKRLTKDAMYGVGMAVIGLQTLSYLGYIKINWSAVEDDIVKAVDQDGDGKLTASDASAILKRFAKFLSTGMPNAAGFSTGFYGAIRYF